MKWWNPTALRQPFWIKLFNWEYWPSIAFYWPMIVYGPLLALRYRHPCFFTAANPAMYSSGFGLESKFETVQMLPAHLRPKSVLLKQGVSLEEALLALKAEAITFPLILKPDVGYRGLLVTRIADAEMLGKYLRTYSTEFIAQEFLDYPEEVGVLYSRMPGQKKGRISSLTLKEFLSVTGDGYSSVRALACSKPRALLQMARIERTHGHVLDTVPAAGEKVNLGIIGNHSKGTLFINGASFIDPALEAVFDDLAGQIPGFYYGRFDIKCQSLERLRKGEGFKIIELNGVCSEPTHIYDQGGMSYPGALRAVLWHWTRLASISAKNHTAGAPYLSARKLLRALAEVKAYSRRLEAIPVGD